MTIIEIVLLVWNAAMTLVIILLLRNDRADQTRFEQIAEAQRSQMEFSKAVLKKMEGK